MTQPIPAAEAIRGLADSLRALGDAVDRGDSYRVLAATLARCRAALAAFERRAPLRDSEELVQRVCVAVRKRLGRSFVINSNDGQVILDAIDSALFGPAAKEGSRGR